MSSGLIGPRGSIPRSARRLVALIGIVIAAGAAAVCPLATAGAADPVSGPTTVTGGHAWNPDARKPFDEPATVTIDQTTDLVNQIVHITWKNFPAGDGQPVLNNNVEYPLAIYECTSTKPASLQECYGSYSFNEKNHIASNTTTTQATYVSRPDGTGYAEFEVRTHADASQLPCDDTHRCSIVVEPNWGGQPPLEAGAAANCDDHSNDTGFAGSGTDNQNYLDSPNNPLNSTCSWSHRIVVPVSFAPTGSECPGRDDDFTAQGSPMLQRAMNQWLQGMCNGAGAAPGLSVQYNSSVDEYSARSTFALGGTDMALTTQPMPGAAGHFTYAPLAVSAMTLAYRVDDQNSAQPIDDLTFNARLLAKAFTQSYTDGMACKPTPPAQLPCEKQLDGNPIDPFNDPEFLKLNPKHKAADFNTEAYRSISSVFGDSDSTYEATRWIASDPGAAAFLKGKTDKGLDNGVDVNTFYRAPKSPDYPISQFNPNDPGETGKSVFNAQAKHYAAVAGIQNTWLPIAGMQNVAKTLVQNKDSSQEKYASGNDCITWPTDGICRQFHASGAQYLGQRALLALVPAGDAAAFGFEEAPLVNGAGKAVAPTAAALTRTVEHDMSTNADGVTQRVDYSKKDPQAYPLTMVDYAAVPTCGLPAVKATAISKFLRYIASDQAQSVGTDIGQLARGFAPLPERLRKQTLEAADAVAGQKASCTPSHTGGTGNPAAPSTNPPGTSRGPGHTGTGPIGAGNGGTGTGGPVTDTPGSQISSSDTGPADIDGSAGNATPSEDGSSAADASGNTPVTSAKTPKAAPHQRNQGGGGREMTGGGPPRQAAAYGTPLADKSAWTRLMLPVVLIAGLAAAVCGSAGVVLGRTGVWPVVVARLSAVPDALRRLVGRP